jgi:TPR repeat protein
LAAKQNHADALMQMGKMHYQKGDAHLYGHVPNDALAQKYFEQAAKQDQPEAHFYLGAIHYLEISRHSYPAKANQHVKKAKKHFTAACQLGDTEACLWQKELTKMHDKAQDSHISINTTPSFT